MNLCWFHAWRMFDVRGLLCVDLSCTAVAVIRSCIRKAEQSSFSKCFVLLWTAKCISLQFLHNYSGNGNCMMSRKILFLTMCIQNEIFRDVWKWCGKLCRWKADLLVCLFIAVSLFMHRYHVCLKECRDSSRNMTRRKRWREKKESITNICRRKKISRSGSYKDVDPS